MSTNVDLAGNVLIVENVRVGATFSGEAGTEIVSVDGDVTVPAGEALTVGTLVVTGPAGAATAAGTGAGSAGASGGAVATHVLTVSVNGTTYYIPLCNTNA